MILLNFSHPLTEEQQRQIEVLVGQAVDRPIDAPSQFDHQRPFAEQVETLVDGVGLTSREWQTKPILVVPPALSFLAAALLAELHGRMGYFPPIVRVRPVEGSLANQYEVAEVIDLQRLRDEARQRRGM